MTVDVTKKARRVTLADVARETGLSPATVSTVLNSAGGECPIASKTQELVVRAARKLGYRASWRARALAKQQTGTVGLIYARVSPFTTGFNQALLESLAARLCRHGYHQLFIPVLEDQFGYQDIIDSDRIDGCLVLAPIPPHMEMIQSAGIPTVLVNVAADLPLVQVLPDDFGGASQVTRHLLDLGHRRMTLVMMDETQELRDHVSLNRRQAGFLDAMNRAGCAGDAKVVTISQALEDLKNKAFLTDGPTAMIAYEHHVAARLLQGAWQNGLRVPQDLSLVSFNDVEFLGYTTPPMTTVALPAEDIANRAADELIQQIQERTTEARQIVLPESLIIRGSTDKPRNLTR